MIPRPLACAVVALGLPVAAALAQSSTYRLDEKGGWVAAPARPMSPDEETIARARRLLAAEKAGEARSVLTAWIDEHGATDNALLPQAYLLRGEAIEAGGNEYKALYDYEAVIKGFPESPEFYEAVEREVEIGIKYVYGLKRIWLGVRWSDATDIGEELLARAVERLPGDKLAERAMIELADYYYRTRELKMAAEAYGIFLANFPKSQYADRARRRRIEANVARFKGPNYDAGGLENAKLLIEDYQATDPAGAQRANLSDAMLARLEESTAAQVLERARWYLKRGDPVSARFTLQRLILRHAQTVAARTAVQMLQERGWELPAERKGEGGGRAGAAAETQAAGQPPAGEGEPESATSEPKQ